MQLDLRLESLAARWATVGAAVTISLFLSYLSVCDFLVGALTDERIQITADAAPAAFITAPFSDNRIGISPVTLTTGVYYFPNSPRLHMRRVDSDRQSIDTSDWGSAESHAIRAGLLSPHDFRPFLQLGWVREDKGDYSGAEEAARAALKLAPANSDTHYQLGVVLLSRENFTEAFKELRAAISASPETLSAVIALIWRNTNESVDALRASTPDEPQHRLALARFLLEQSRPVESAAVLRDCDPKALVQLRDTGAYLDSLIAAGHTGLAYDIWRKLIAPTLPEAEVQNGGFESEILLDFAQFDWSIQPSKYAVVSVDANVAHAGSHSLRIDYLGHETTRLENEIRQIVMLRQGVRYRLSYYVRTENLTAPEGPRVSVKLRGSDTSIAAADPAPDGSHDWQSGAIEFTAPADSITVAIKQTPKFSYETPTRGTVWFDDFELQEIR